MRNPRARCALCKHRGSIANKIRITGKWGDGYLCNECAFAICNALSPDRGTQAELFAPKVEKCIQCGEREVLTQGWTRKCPVCSKAEPGK